MSESAWCLPNHAWMPRVSSPVPNAPTPGILDSLEFATCANDAGFTVFSIFIFSLSAGVVIVKTFVNLENVR